GAAARRFRSSARQQTDHVAVLGIGVIDGQQSFVIASVDGGFSRQQLFHNAGPSLHCSHHQRRSAVGVDHLNIGAVLNQVPYHLERRGTLGFDIGGRHPSTRRDVSSSPCDEAARGDR